MSGGDAPSGRDLAARGVQRTLLRVLGARFSPVEVRAADDLAPCYRRVTFHGPELLARRPMTPALWLRLWFEDGDRRAQRAFTFVDPDPGSGTFDVWFALHDADGPAVRWARTARPGDVLGATVLTRPLVLPTPPPAAALLAGDETAVPAIASILAALPPSVAVRVLLQGPPGLPLRSAGHVRVEHVPDLAGAVATLALEHPDTYAWVAAESDVVRDVKRLLREQHGLPPARVGGQGYWRAGQAMGSSR
jgi:NADPH-dependent ferric siderophore reductase